MISYLDSILIFLPNLVGVVCAAMCLSLIGSQLSARQEVLQSFVVSQAASLGVTVGLVIALFEIFHSFESLLPIVSSFVVASLFFVLCRKLSLLYRPKSSEILITIFLFVMALNFLLVKVFPAIESHFAASYSGDITTASAVSCYFVAFISFVTSIFLVYNYKQLTFNSFWMSSSQLEFNALLEKLFYVFCALMIVLSTKFFGFMFTSASLIILPLAASLTAQGLSKTVKVLLIYSLVSVLSGFLLSLWFEEISTSASIITLQALAVLYALLREGCASRLK